MPANNTKSEKNDLIKLVFAAVFVHHFNHLIQQPKDSAVGVKINCVVPHWQSN